MRKQAKEIAKDISNFVNGARPSEVKQLAEEMSNDHPTLQQNTMGLVMEFIQKMASKNYVDARNESSAEMAQAALEGIRQMFVKKFINSGMTTDKAESHAKTCVENISLPFI